MRRRDFITLLGGVVAAWPLAARAQQPGKLLTLGFLGTTSASAWTPWTAAFVERLGQLGWIEGRTIAIEYRWAEGKSERFEQIAAEFVQLKTDIIVTSGAAGLAVKQATSVIPVVLALANDPVGAGLVANLSRPGGNITGLSLQTPDVAGKRIEILRELLPGLRRLALLADIGYPASRLEVDEVQRVAAKLGFEIVKLEVQKAADIVPALEQLHGSVDALYVCTGPLINTNRVSINDVANAAHLPTIHSEKLYIEAGGLICYGPVVDDMFRRAAELVDKILKGAKPGDIPIEQPTKFEMVINLKTARMLGLTLPPTLLARADEVIE
jgi:putative tryptophan/tyrosine transport system substrate-binding protein